LDNRKLQPLISGFFKTLGLPTAAMVIFSVMLSDFFDTMGTAVALGQKAGFIDQEGKFRGIHRVLLVDSLGAIFGGFCNSRSNTLYIESAVGVGEGGRTGLTAVFVGLFFLRPFCAVRWPPSSQPRQPHRV